MDEVVAAQQSKQQPQPASDQAELGVKAPKCQEYLATLSSTAPQPQ